MSLLKGRFHAIDDVDMNGHHLRDWRYLSDIPQGGASTNNVLAWDGEVWTPTTISGTGIATIYWDDVQDKPSTFPPDSHTHPWSEVTGKPSVYPPEDHTHSFTGLDDDLQGALKFFVGAVIGSPIVDVTSDGSIITLEVSSVSGTLTLLYSTGAVDYSTSPAPTIALTPGTDAAPTSNYIYIPIATKVLTVSTVGWPAATEYVPIATVVCQSAASAQTYGLYKVHAWTDHTFTEGANGHLGHLNEWIREQNATWISGVACTPTLGAAQFDLAVISGVILQLHDHNFPAFTTVGGSEPLYVINDFTTAYKRVANMTAELTDSLGATLSNRYYSIVLWGVVSEDAEDCKLMVNLPSGSYNVASSAQGDTLQYSEYGIPSEFRGTGFLIARVVVKHAPAGSTFTLVETIDLRGTFPSGFGGGSSGSGDHGGLTGLADPDHPLTALQQSGAVADQGVVWNGATWVPDNLVNAVTAGTNILVSGTTGLVTISTTSTPTFATITEGSSTLANKYASLSHTHTTTYTVNVILSGGGSTLSATGLAGGFRIPTDSTLISASMYADQSGTLSVEVYGTTYAGYTANLTDLTGGNDFDMSGAVKVDNTTLTAWTTSFDAGDLFTYGVTGTVNNVTWAVVSLTFEKVIP